MKKASYPACAALALAAVAAAGSVSFLGPCVHEDGAYGPCHWAGQMLLGVGILLAAQSLLALMLKRPGAKLGAYLAMLPTALLGVFTPGALIPLCGMATMRCRSVMQPAEEILLILCFLCAGVGCLLSGKAAQREKS